MIAARAASLLLWVALTGCSTSSIEEKGTTRSVLAHGEAVVVLGDEIGIPACLRRVIQRPDPDLDVIASLDFRNSLFPWFELATAPRTAEELTSLLNRPKVQQRIESLNVRYVIAVSGRTTETSTVGVNLIYGGFATWDRETRLSVIAWDLVQIRKAKTFQARIAGTALVPVIAFLPLPLIPATETEACKQLGNRLTNFLTGKSRPEN